MPTLRIRVQHAIMRTVGLTAIFLVVLAGGQERLMATEGPGCAVFVACASDGACAIKESQECSYEGCTGVYQCVDDVQEQCTEYPIAHNALICVNWWNGDPD